MKVELAFNIDKTKKISFQGDFPHITKCCRCGKRSRLAFVAHEWKEKSEQEGGKYVCQIWENEPKQLWLHDAIAVAVYFCEKCLESTALYNQA